MKKSKATQLNVALSVRQPWAWFIVNGYKDVENRGWEFDDGKLGKRIYIHAGKAVVSEDDYEEFKAICKENKIKKYPKSPEDFEYGAIVGSVVLVGMDHKSKSDWAQRGAVHWLLKDAQTIKPVTQKGMLGFFKVKL